MTNRYMDYLSHMRVQQLEDGIFRTIDSQQRALTPARSFAEVAMTFYLECQVLGLDISTVMSTVSNAVQHLQATDTEKLRAIRMYIDKEMAE